MSCHSPFSAGLDLSVGVHVPGVPGCRPRGVNLRPGDGSVTAAVEYVGMGFEATVLESYVGSRGRTAALLVRGLRWVAAVSRGCARWAHAWLPALAAGFGNIRWAADL